MDEGLKKESEIASFVLKETLQIFPATCQFGGSNIASDGVHLYIQNKRALFKVGSGFQSTLMVRICCQFIWFIIMLLNTLLISLIVLGVILVRPHTKIRETDLSSSLIPLALKLFVIN